MSSKQALCVSIDSKPPPDGLDKEFQDVIKLNKYSPTTRKLVANILKALQVFDCYDTMVKKKRPLWSIGSDLSSAAFDALRGITRGGPESVGFGPYTFLEPQKKVLDLTVIATGHREDIIQFQPKSTILVDQVPHFQSGNLKTLSPSKLGHKRFCRFYRKVKSMSTVRTSSASLKKTQQQFTNTISVCLVVLKNLQIAFQKKPDIVGQIDNKGSPCFMGGNMYHKDDCEKCRLFIPGFKSKSKSIREIRAVILNLQLTIPKQFLYYGNDIFVVIAESIRIIDKMHDCVTSQSDTAKCESRDKSFKLFTKRMNEVTTNENDHVKMIVFEETKLKIIVAQLVLEVTSSMEMMAECLHFKSGMSIFDLWKKGLLPSMEPTAKNVGVDINKAKVTDTERVVPTIQHEGGISVGTRVARRSRHH